MGREYVDLHVTKFDPRTAETLVALGFKHVCTTDFKKNMSVSSFHELSVYGKAVVEARSRSELLQRLKAVDRKLLIGVKPLTREALIVAARDRRVGTVMAHGEVAELDRHVLQVFDNSLEITVSELAEAFKDLRKWRNLQKLCKTAARFQIPLIISSGAGGADELMPPKQLACVLSAMKEVQTPDLDAVSTTPLKLVREKLER
ncbi:MAG: hypothetical protein QW470_03130 [Candidatus Caldarchaeum sp.]